MDQTELKGLVVYGSIVLLLIIVLIIVFSLLLRSCNPPKERLDNLSEPVVESGYLGSDKLDISDFMIPNPYLDEWKQDWIFFRQRLNEWNQGQIEPYWKDPRKIVLEILADKNDQLIQKILDEVP